MSYDVELAVLRARLAVNPDDAAAKRRIADVEAAAKAAAATPPVIEVVESPMEVETVELPTASTKRRAK
jgi:hypothetical protein